MSTFVKTRTKFILGILGLLGVGVALYILLGVVSQLSPQALGLSLARPDYDQNISGQSPQYQRAESQSRSYVGGSYAELARESAPSMPGGYQGEESPISKLIKTGSLDIVATDVEMSVTEIATIAERLGGFVSDRNIFDAYGGKKSATMTVRLPADSFEEGLRNIKTTAVRVTDESLNTTDVGEEYSDLEAQLSNKRAVEAQYLATLTQASRIEDILNVQERLDVVRGEIERMEGRIKYLDRQVALSSLSISITAESEVAVFGVVWEPLTKVKQAAYDTLENLIEFVYVLIALLFFVPVAALWAALFGGIGYLTWKLLTLAWRRIQGSGPTSGA